MEARQYVALVNRLDAGNIIKGHTWSNIIMYKGLEADEKLIRVRADHRELDGEMLIRINEEDSRPAWAIVEKAWDEWCEGSSGESYENIIEDMLSEAGLWYEAIFPENVEEYYDEESALWSWEHPEAWDEAERNWRDRNPQLRDDERI